MNQGNALSRLADADREQLMRFGKLMHIALKGMPRLTHAQRKEIPKGGRYTRGTHRRNAMALWKQVAEGQVWVQEWGGFRALPLGAHRQQAHFLFSHAILSGVPEERAIGIAAIALT